MKAKLSELKLEKVRRVLEYELNGEKKCITIYNALGKKRENLITMLESGSKINDKNKAVDLIYKSILKELVDLDIDVKNTNTLLKTPNLIMLQLNHEIDEIMCELQCEYIYNQMRLLNQAKVSALTALSLKKADEMKEEVEKLRNANV